MLEKESTVTFDSQDISAMERTETISKSQQGSPVAPPRIKGRAARPSQKIRKPEIIGEVVKPVEGMSGWGDGAATMGWGTHDEETPTQSNVGESEQPSQVRSIIQPNSDLVFQVEVINIGTEKHVPIPEYYEETVEIEDRQVPGSWFDSYF